MGGTWQQQNKALPGAYINILGNTPLSIKLSDRGIVALPMSLKWGTKGEIYKIHSGDNTIASLGYEIDDLIPVREALKNASEVLVCRVNGGTKAKVELTTGVTATAKYEGSRGNDITVVTKANASKFDIVTYLDTLVVDSQTISSYGEFKDNGFITITGTGSVVAGTKKLTTGSDTDINQTDYNTILLKLKTYNFNTLAYGGNMAAVQTDIEDYVRDLRENEGIKVQAVMTGYNCDYEGILIVDSGIILSDGTELTPGDVCYWVAGATAGANINQSNTGKVYQDAINVSPRLVKTDMEKKVEQGKIIFKVDNNQRVTLVYDINSLLTYAPSKKESFRKNRVIRTLDSIANDIASVWEYNYMGKIDNNAEGRNLYKGSLVEYFKGLQQLNAIENFSPEDIVIEPGIASDAIIVKVGVQVTDSAEKLYITVTV